MDPNTRRYQRHSHSFGQDKKRPGEIRTIIVIAITAIMMVVEVSTGILFGSIALLADGLHMATHAAALSINAFAYIYARRHAHDTRFSFGTGKVNALGGFSGAILLVLFALIMAWKSLDRIIYPIDIAFNQAILVAVLGLLVNGGSVFILGINHRQSDGQAHDHNLRAAYFHVLADALTSVLAIFALLAGKYFGLFWMDPLMGIVGAILILRWSFGLLHATSAVLLDMQGPVEIQKTIKESIEAKGDHVTDLHLWSIGPNMYGLIVSVAAHNHKPPEYYKQLIPHDLGLKHITVEVLTDLK
jgi:cation diffusion facilitator family transporter